MTKRFRLIFTIILVVGCCMLIGYALYRMGDTRSNSTKAPESTTKTTRQKNLDWLKTIQGIRDEPTAPTTTTSKTIQATTTIEIATSTKATTSTDELPQETATTSTRKKQPTRGTNQK
ncbi:MAG: hypothetical protein KIH65_005055 [Candidatus Uhrbacteria bacterium]|nr:hypothetical protein [Candidatus Uhrbacteria bacterium]